MTTHRNFFHLLAAASLSLSMIAVLPAQADEPSGAAKSAAGAAADVRKADRAQIGADRKQVKEDRQAVKEAAKAGDREAAAGAVEKTKEDRKTLAEDRQKLREDRRDQREGGKQAVAEAWRNITAVGGKPLAITDNLNFGNPERPEIMGQFVGAIKGIGEACRALEFPIVSGNVSLYNETDGSGILPTPTIGAVGLLSSLEDLIAGLPPPGAMPGGAGQPQTFMVWGRAIPRFQENRPHAQSRAEVDHEVKPVISRGRPR